ncbi:MAG: hypothetical protein HY043_09930 [Verrucomicrobia bacterium]|nr:hypothetical protein [Verrucomicrobiota bacterium]
MSSTWRSMATREFSLLPVPCPAMNSAMSLGFGARGKGCCSMMSRARARITFVMLACVLMGPQ